MQVKLININMVNPEEKQKSLKQAFCHNHSTKDKHDKLYHQSK